MLREPAYSQTLIQNKIDRPRVRSRESGRQADSQTAVVDGVWSWDGERGREERVNQDRICWRALPVPSRFGSATPRVRHSQGEPLYSVSKHFINPTSVLANHHYFNQLLHVLSLWFFIKLVSIDAMIIEHNFEQEFLHENPASCFS